MKHQCVRVFIGLTLILACGRSPAPDPRTPPALPVHPRGFPPTSDDAPRSPVRETEDARLDLYCLDHPDCGVRDRARVRHAARASMAIFAHDDLIPGPGVFTIHPKYRPLAATRDGGDPPMCADEAFAEQPRGATCSGVVIAGPRLLSARHCLAGKADPYFVRAFVMADAGSPLAFEFAASDVCRPAPGARLECFGEVCVVDLMCEGPTPPAAEVASLGLHEGDPVYAIGYPEYLPAKFSGWGEVSFEGGGTFTATLNIDPGNSGSPVFNGDHKLVGVINAEQGPPRIYTDPAAGCQRWRRGAAAATVIAVSNESLDKEQRP